MKLLKCTLVLTSIAFFLAACSGSIAPPPSPDSSLANPVSNTASSDNAGRQNSSDNNEFAAAKIIYEQKCIKCHQPNGEGGKIQAQTAILKVPNFRDPRNQDDDDADYIEKVELGATGRMPAFKGKLTDDEIKSVVSYIRHEFQGK